MNSQIAQYRYGIFLILLMISFPLTQQLGKTNKAKELSPRPNEPAQAAKQLEPSSDLQVSSFIELNSQSQIPSRHPANRQGSECQTNRQCQYLNSCIKGKCVHKSLYDPRLAEILGLFLILIGSGISNAGGIGGGGLLIPILILQLRFETHEAIPISKLMIFTGALTAFLMGLRNNKHPYRDGGAIDYNLASMLIPMILFGTMVGVTLNKLTPPWIILVSLTLCLVINTVKTIQKGIKLYQKENIDLYVSACKKDHLDSADSKEHGSLVSYRLSSKEDPTVEHSTFDKLNTVENSLQVYHQEYSNLFSSKEDLIEDTKNNPNLTKANLLQVEYQKDKDLFPIAKLKYSIIAFFCLIAIALMKGSSHFNSVIGVPPCSLSYWLLFVSFLPVAVSLTYLTAKSIQTEITHRRSIGYSYHSEDIKWTRDMAVKYPLYAFFGGLLAGLLGIGGGLVLGPMLLEIGVNPVVSTATSNFLVLFTSSSTTLQFVVLGMLNFRYGVFCTVSSTLGSFLGALLIQRLVERTNRSSMLIFTLAGVLLVSTVFIPGHTVIQIRDQLARNLNIWDFQSAC